MFTFKCPQCDASAPVIDLRQRFSRQGRKGKRPCRSCGAWLELENGFQVGVLMGLFCGFPAGLIASLLQAHVFPDRWLAQILVCVAVAVPIAIPMAAFVVSRFGRWHVLADGYHDSGEVKKWSRLSAASCWIGLGIWLLALLAVAVQAGLLPGRMLADRDSEAVTGLALRSFITMGACLLAGLTLSLVAMWIGYRAWRKRTEARLAERGSTVHEGGPAAET
jgi:hypothetical protein